MTQNTATQPKKDKDLTDEQVYTFLTENTNFLEKYPDLLDELITPAGLSGDGVVDFQTILVEKLKADKTRFKELQRELIEATQYNLENWTRIQAACLALLEAEDFEDLVTIISQDFPAILDVDVCCLVVEAYGNEVPAFKHPCLSIVKPGAIRDRLGKDGYACLHGDIYGDPDIYGPAAETIKSEALLRLDIAPKSHKGLIAFGSEQHDTFSPEQDIDQIAFLGQVVERFIRQFLDL